MTHFMTHFKPPLGVIWGVAIAASSLMSGCARSSDSTIDLNQLAPNHIALTVEGMT